jgi:hypothetical protein
MNAKAIFNILEALQKDLSEIKERLDRIPARKIPSPAGHNPMGKKKCFSHKLMGAFKDREIRAFVMTLRAEGMKFDEIAARIRERWPYNPEKHPSRSAIHRFYQAARAGRLEEYGIKRTIA